MKKLIGVIFAVVFLVLSLVATVQIISAQNDYQNTEPFFSMVLMGRAGTFLSDIDVVVADEWSKLNIDVTPVILDFRSWVDRSFGYHPDYWMWRGNPYSEGGFDYMSDTHHYGPLAASPHHWDYVSYGVTDFNTRNPGLLNDTDIDAWMEEILSLDYSTQKAEIEALYRKIEIRMIEEQSYTMSVCTIPYVLFYKTGLTGIPPGDHFDRWQFRDVHWDDQDVAEERSLVIARMGEVSDFGRGRAAFVHEPLVEYDPVTGEIVPVLATSINWDPTTNIFTINLRQGVTWHDGVPFNATDVWGAIYTVLNPAMLHSYRPVFEDMLGGSLDVAIQNVNIVDAYTVEITLPNGMNSLIFDWMGAHDGGGLQPWHIMREFADRTAYLEHTFNTGIGMYEVNSTWGSLPTGQTYTAYGPIGTGSWYFMGKDPTTLAFMLKRYVNYWGGLPWLNDLTVVVIPDIDSAIAALKAGSVDVIRCTGEDYAVFPKILELQGRVDIQTFVGQPQNWLFYLPNMQHPILGTGVDTPLGQQDPSRAAEAASYVRRALDCMMPREAIADTFFGGVAEIMYSHRTPGLWGNMEVMEAREGRTWAPFEYNMTKAMEFMEMAGYDYVGWPPVDEPEPEPEPEPGVPIWAYGIGAAVVIVGGISVYSLVRKKD
jgi:ABC-type transport system substrate-binding protein